MNLLSESERPSDLDADSKGSSLERMLRVLDLFTEASPIWAVDEMGAALGYTRSTIYRYVRELAEASLLFQVEAGRYALGARIITWDRQLRLSDPLVRAAQSLEQALPRWSEQQVWLICRLFKDQVVCIHQHGELFSEVSYSRGSPRPLFLGATSKAILANMTSRQHRQLFLENPDEVRASHLGQTWEQFRRALQQLRRQGYVASAAEIDPGVYGLAAPIFDSDGKVLGSISCVRPIEERDNAQEAQQGEQMLALAQTLSQRMAALTHRPAQPD
ncbi:MULTISPECIES: IclR family transcriptional regulator [Pseudomonas]|jgi:DNA-binding IclR family transcriptional regulator|uniref:HTH-type transcriptional repressor AllR n=2 Tax=Pseudomonas fluorescens TaxID=294 RepID=C3JZJ7_PSEFS|nr:MULTISPECIES: IclR family transcriptional regulator C-terminal domain-containing protein [Pseudomonas]KJZ53867.1 IclR family transcriptional regulator [Pseudomonas marginalis]KJZ58599.1 IclR family transcriptional regulator [Pseudomonas marginalis]MBZ6456712.1 helix-turn-helix domain-containing protein [Pseudomonas fluorescens group sp.]MBZ6462659.1 helix-turn-helix domain-containing protein [Pseudomonas fluorescens group sp.]MBZ6468800.1 helix-turn-helix domain-containing protein [Pseudomo